MSRPVNSTWGFPYDIDGSGRTSAADRDSHLRDLIEQVLFTAAGERVMRPDFGSGLLGMVFDPGGPEIAATAQYLIQGALEHWLGDVISVESVTVGEDGFEPGSSVVVTVSYRSADSASLSVADFRVGPDAMGSR